MSNADLAAIVDFRYDVAETEYIEGHHPGKCPGLSDDTDLCNYLSGGADLCAQAHEPQWQTFLRCMSEYAAYGHDNNTLNGDFDARLGDCSVTLTNFSVAELRSCTYGPEGAALRAESTARYLASSYCCEKYDVWVEVDGTAVLAASDTNPRDEWVAEVVDAVCAAYGGPRPAACDAGIVV